MTTVMRGKVEASTTNYSHFSTETVFQDYRLNVEGNPEVSAWHQLMLIAQRFEQEPSKKRIGFIVDSELGKIRDINYRKIPLIDNYYLPKNFELMYATDASGSEEYIPNRLIRYCDSNSKKVLANIQRDNNLTRE